MQLVARISDKGKVSKVALNGKIAPFSLSQSVRFLQS